jgi:hypothetical protein
LCTGITFARGKIVKTSVAFDYLHIWRQLGVDLPEPPAADPSTAEYSKNILAVFHRMV